MNENGHGGKREGAGRKKKSELGLEKFRSPRKPTLSIVGTTEELEKLREIARSNNKTVSRLILDTFCK